MVASLLYKGLQWYFSTKVYNGTSLLSLMGKKCCSRLSYLKDHNFVVTYCCSKKSIKKTTITQWLLNNIKRQLLLVTSSSSVCPCLAKEHRVPSPYRLPQCVAKTGKNHSNKEITPLLPTGIVDRFSQPISNLGHAGLLRRCELPL
jgi:hypothetical protein